MNSDSVILHAEQITKVFPGTVALDHVDFRVRPGKVCALIGENGAGKSTLVRILAGAEQPTTGRLVWNGEQIRLRTPRHAAAHGIGIIHQELSLFPNLSVTENIFMGCHVTRAGAIDSASQRRQTREILTRLEQPIHPDAIVGKLPLGQQQIVEIARALVRDVRVLMMDEPTSALSSSEIAVLFRVVRELKAQGVGIVYISHKLDELMKIGDYVTVLRDGRLVAEAPVKEVSVDWIVERMTGRRTAPPAVPTSCSTHRELLRISGLTIPGLLHDVSLNVCSGEVVGIYGLLGAGRTELLECIGGIRKPFTGTVQLDGRGIDGKDVRDRIRAGLAMVPEDRQAAGLVSAMSVRDNITLAGLPKLARASYLSPGREAAAASSMIATLGIKVANPMSPVSSLSGGNQQKAVIAKCLLTRPKVLLLDEPTRGVDVGARAEIFETISQLAAEGMGVLFASSDLHEVLTLSTRILVMSRGHLTAAFQHGSATENALVNAASAAHGGRDARN